MARFLESEQFKYAALEPPLYLEDAATIRLLKLLPGAPGSAIKTRLTTTTVISQGDKPETWSKLSRESQNSPEYRSKGFAALSYEWGDPTSHTAFIYVDDKSFSIRPYLWKFLNEIRTQWASALPIRLWVDSICINQDDVEEKASQVQIMHRIYAQAREVLVWLGDEADSSKSTFRLLRQYVEEMHSKHRTMWDELIGSKLSVSSRTGNVLSIMRNNAEYERRQAALPSNLFRSDHNLRVALLKLCRRTYWTRSWIIQECLNAKQVSLFCGDEHLPHTAFPLLGHLCSRSQKSEEQLAPELAHSVSSASQLSGFDPASRVIELTRRWYVDRHDGLESLLQSYHGSKCSNPYDKVYAFTGLSSDGDDFPIDYTISMDTLLARTIVFCSDSKARRTRSGVDPVRKTCDSIHVAQLLVEDLEILRGLDDIDRLQQNASDSLVKLLSILVTVELDYLGMVDHFPGVQRDQSRNVFMVGTRIYQTLTTQSYNRGDRAFALRGTPMLLIYHRSLRALHFVGLAVLSTSPSIVTGEHTPLLAEQSILYRSTRVIDPEDTTESIVDTLAQAWTFPSPDPIPRYRLQHGRHLPFHFFRTYILPLLPLALAYFLMTTSPDSAFHASPSFRLPLRQVLEIVSIWPERVNSYEAYCERVKLEETHVRRTVGRRMLDSATDFLLRVENSVVMMWGGSGRSGDLS